MGNCLNVFVQMRNLIVDKIVLQQIDKESFVDVFDGFSFKVIWVNSGNCELFVDAKRVVMSDGDCVVLMPEHQFAIQAIPTGSISYLSFSVDYLQLEARNFSIDIFKLFIKRIGNEIIRIDTASFLNIGKLKELLFSFNGNSKLEQEVSINLFNSILLILVNANHDFVSLPDKYYERIHDFFLLVFENSKKEKRVTFYADQLNISSKRLNQILQEFTNKSASYFIQEHLIMEAKRRLNYGDMNINQIADELGFDDVAYFSRFFKKWTALSPEKYRKKFL